MWWWWCWTLFICEVYLTITHAIVLSGGFSIAWIPWTWMRASYFCFDALVVMATFAVIRTNHVLIAIHLTIHTLAIAQLAHDWSPFFRNVYLMAEQDYGDKSQWHVLGYVVGTLEDIATHCVNAYVLFTLK